MKAMSAPSRASRSTVARPMPREPPVTRARGMGGYVPIGPVFASEDGSVEAGGRERGKAAAAGACGPREPRWPEHGRGDGEGVLCASCAVGPAVPPLRCVGVRALRAGRLLPGPLEPLVLGRGARAPVAHHLG